MNAVITETTLHAQPYDMDKRGFYFTDMESYEKGVEASGAEEFEIQFIDGEDAQLFNACKINQANLAKWFDDVQPLSDDEKIALFFLVSENGYYLEDALEVLDDVIISEQTLEECAEQFFDDCYLHEVPQFARAYIDYEKFARDCRLGGDMSEFEYNGRTYTCSNAGSL